MADEDKKFKELEEKFDGLQSEVKNIVKGMGQLTSGMKSFTENIAASIQKTKDDDDPPRKPSSSDYNLETMNRTEFYSHIMDGFTDGLTKLEEKLIGGMTEIREGSDLKELKTQWDRALKRHPDLIEWKGEMAEIAKKAKGLNVEEVYQLARLGNPEKAEQMDTRLRKEAEEKDKEAKDKEAKDKEKERKERAANPVFGGLTPTSSTEEASQKMSKDESAELAWEKTFGGRTDI